jgi:hypothetical protein
MGRSLRAGGVSAVSVIDPPENGTERLRHERMGAARPEA